MKKGEKVIFLGVIISFIGLILTSRFYPEVINNPQPTITRSAEESLRFYEITFLAMFFLMEVLWYKIKLKKHEK